MQVETNAMFVSMHWSDNGHGRGDQRITVRGIRTAIDARLKTAGIKKPGVELSRVSKTFCDSGGTGWSNGHNAEPLYGPYVSGDDRCVH